ncbi:MAG: YifB family Mg chelatase-like AAA ATPase [Actinobacteria bacterium]|nr:YifB family Mg chelatase-like AAA ATPase [Actinomycetota bacterium]
MALATVCSATLLGVEGQPVTVEVHVSSGLPGYTVVGLPDTAVRESRDRVRAALLSSELEWPLKKVTINLAPSGVRKSGAGLDLAVALALLEASDQLPAACLDGVGVLGELGLDGSVRPVPGILPLVAALADAGLSTVVVPSANAPEAALVPGVTVRPAAGLLSVRECLKGEATWAPAPPAQEEHDPMADDGLDLGDVRGLAVARRALEIAAAGGHHLLFVGPPGVGKTMLSRRLPSILSPLRSDEAFEVTRIRSAMGEAPRGLQRHRPFRAPHHTASTPALVGGGSGTPRPGEVTRSHRGVLFLDELGEFKPTALEALRQPLEERVVRIARHPTALEFPAAFTLVATSNPCPCGLGPPACACDDAKRARYRRRLSAPLLDRFDLRVLVAAPENRDAGGEGSAEVRARVHDACARQARRYRDRPWRRNADVPAGALAVDIPLDRIALDALLEAADLAGLTGRGLSAVRRTARTLADLEGAPDVGLEHALFAVELRQEVFE